MEDIYGYISVKIILCFQSQYQYHIEGKMKNFNNFPVEIFDIIGRKVGDDDFEMKTIMDANRNLASLVS